MLRAEGDRMNPLEEVKTMWITLFAMRSRINHFNLTDPTLGLEDCETGMATLLTMMQEWIFEYED
jgi:hypothetical protein